MAILINDTAPRAQYTATSGQTAFTVAFEFFANSDLKVYRNATLLTLTTNYTVTGAGVTGGGTVTLVTGATAGDIVTIVRDVPVARTSDFPTSGPFNIEALNTDLDRLTAMVQQQETLDGRSLRLDQFDTPNTFNVLPSKSARAGRVLQFNDTTGQPEAGPTTSEVANAQTYATNASTSATAAAASASTASSAASSTAGSVAAAAASASAASTSATNSASSASAASTSASNASTSASNASTSATAASGSASTASTQATNAASSASAASTSASNASTSATSANSAKVAAESARDATLAAYDSFDDRYLGAKSSDPSVDNDGNALVAGALYFNSTDGIMKLYTGSAWVAAYVSGAGFLALSGGTMTGQVAFAAGSVSAPGISASGDTNTGIFFPAADTIAFAEGGTEVMRINSSGNVGIGTASPSFKFDVTGTTRFTGLTQFDNSINLKAAILNYVYFDDALAFAKNGTGERMRIDSSGNVGIGRASTGYRLEVGGSADTTLAVISTSGSNGAGLLRLVGSDVSALYTPYNAVVSQGSTGTQQWYIGGDGNVNTLVFKTSTSERFRFGSSGQLGIGGANYGTSGQVLTSGGSGAAPSWAAPSVSGTLIRAPQVLTSGTSYTTPSNCTRIFAEIIGGGGSGAGSAGSVSLGGGGGAGGYVSVYLTVTGSTAYTYAIGAGGASVTGAVDGNAGGSTTITVGTAFTANGGGFGLVGSFNGRAGEGGSGSGTGATVIKGGDGITGMAANTGALCAGSGGASFFGGGGNGGTGSSAPSSARSGVAYGSGGGGAAISGNSGAGAQGVIRIWEYT
jgi:hypothetical protein